MSFAIYIVGFLIVIGGIAWAMVALHIPQQWVLITCVILLGIGIVRAVTNTRAKGS
jgi:uncharacterized protein (DUF983 family)